MKTILCVCALTLLSGCGSYLADRSAKQACSGFPVGTTDYANCYAQAYENERAGLRATGAAMMGTGAALAAPPVVRPVPVTSTCQWIGNTWTCNSL